MEVSEKTRTGLLNGSFNPVHIGHLIIAHYLLLHSDLREIWFVISPHNPLKNLSELLPEETRLAMLKLAIDDQPGFFICERELKMERPSYTFKTLETLRIENPDRDFVLIIGSDNLEVFSQWKDYDKILTSTDIYVYPRKDRKGGYFTKHPRVRLFDAPLIEISSEYIRCEFSEGRKPRYMLPYKVFRLILEKKLL
ncbi:MAG TPA: nicotinate (nicotinamide) nucleotide adenylyltransferase [Bacteroidales bacterium]|nr:nicotinate (nicotinamide) nucleotide adenylyltransferase [Bacteroidales bacterium]